MQTEHTHMIRRTEVPLSRKPGMPMFDFACPQCGRAGHVQAGGERECEGCSAPLTLTRAGTVRRRSEQ